MELPYRKEAQASAKQFNARRELPQTKTPETYCWLTEEGAQRCAVVKGTERQILEQLRITPMYSASIMNLSAYIARLRKLGAPIATHNFKSKETGGAYGIYALKTTLSVPSNAWA